jgi:threonine/homoserine/homoserine lactone efflux protein
MTSWGWTGKYVLVIIVALLLGVALGNLALFQSATFGNPKHTAGLLVQFISHMGALALLWTLGWRAAEQMRESGQRRTTVAMIILAFITLVITAVSYVVLSNFINPFIAKDMKEVVSWVFIFGVLAAATWFILALFSGAEDLIASLRDAVTGKKQNLTSPSID